MGKLVYSWIIQRDKTIPGTLVRSSTIPEELGRIEYLLSDKTGTLTKNEMVFRKLQLGTVSYGQESMAEVGHVQHELTHLLGPVPIFIVHVSLLHPGCHGIR